MSTLTDFFVCLLLWPRKDTTSAHSLLVFNCLMLSCFLFLTAYIVCRLLQILCSVCMCIKNWFALWSLTELRYVFWPFGQGYLVLLENCILLVYNKYHTVLFMFAVLVIFCPCHMWAILQLEDSSHSMVYIVGLVKFNNICLIL